MLMREIRTWLPGRIDRFGGYVRLWFDGPGISWRTGLSRRERPSVQVLKSVR